MPLSLAIKIGMALGGFVYKFVRIRRKVALQNLKIAFSEKSQSELEEIAYQSYRHFGGVAVEFARLPKINTRYCERYIVFEGAEVLRKAGKQGKGCINIAGHIGNWEVMGAVSAFLGYKATYVVANQTNKLVDEFMDNLRRSQGIEIIKIHNAPRGVLTAFKNNRYVALMIDQDAGRDCVFVDFFGKLASTHRGPAVFHLKTQTPLVMSSCIRLKGPHYRVLFEDVHLPPLEGTQEEKNTQIMAHLTKLLEEKVRQHPEQYFWMHKRWKTRPQ